MSGGRSCTVFAVDVSPSMGETITVPSGSGDGKTKTVTKLEYGLEYVRAKIGAMLLGGLKTVYAGIVLFGSDKSDNCLIGQQEGYDYIWEYIKPAAPSGKTLLQLDAISSFLSATTAEDKGDALTALILAVHVLDTTPKVTETWKKSVVVVTDGESATVWQGVEETKQKMLADRVVLTVVGLDFDDPHIGFKQEAKSATKADNELMFARLCSALPSAVCGSALAAIPDSLSPQPRIVKSVPTSLILTLGFPGSEEEALEKGYKPEQTLRIACQLRKCTISVRPMGAKQMGKIGLKVEEMKLKKQMEWVEKMMKTGGKVRSGAGAGPAGKAKGKPVKNENGEKEDEDVEMRELGDGEDDELQFQGMLSKVTKYVYTNTSGVHTDGPGKKRKRVGYDEGTGLENKDDYEDDCDGSEEEEEDVALEHANKDDLVKAYKYGAMLVPVDQFDEQEIRINFKPGLEILGFVSISSIPRHHFLGDVYFLFANPDQVRAQLRFSALMHGMHELDRAALCRYVSKYKNAEPILVVLLPQLVGGVQFCYFIQVPFAEDLREYSFASLQFIKTRSGKTLMEHKNIATDEMKSAMERLVDEMDLSSGARATEEKDEDGEDGRNEGDGSWLDIYDAYSPSVHHLKNAILRRLTHPGSTDLPEVHPELKEYLARPDFVVEKSRETVEELKALLDVKKGTRKAKAVKRKSGGREFPNETQDIDIDAILGGGSSQPMYADEPGSTLKASGNRIGRLEYATFSQSGNPVVSASGSDLSPFVSSCFQFQSGSQTQKEGAPAEQNHIEYNDSATDEREDKVPPPHRKSVNRKNSTESVTNEKRKRRKALIGMETPIVDFRKLVDNSEVANSDMVGEAVGAMCDVAKELVKTSFSRQNFKLAVDCLKEVREYARREDETDTYNKFMCSFKDLLNQKSFKHKDFWGLVKDNCLGLITLKESESEEGVLQKEADEFYGY